MKPFIDRVPDAETKEAARAIAAELPDGDLTLKNARKPLPPAVADILREVIAQFAAGKSVSLILQDEEVSPNEAAELLHVSRGTITKLMDEGRLPYREVGAHRRVPVAAVVAFATLQRARQQAAMEELVRLDQELGLYDNPSPPPPKSAFRGTGRRG